MAKPRIFVSSTYYDLRYVREGLKDFISLYEFDPILNEFGGVTYKHSQELDKSCFDEVKNSDMLILIVGGRYGSAISDEKDYQYDFYDQYTSITSEEFRTAYDNGIPTYIFIENNVNAEYYTFSRNVENDSIKYAHVDSINILKFVLDLRNKFSNSIIFTFGSITDITCTLRTQWAGLFHNMLREKKEKKESEKIKDGLDKLSVLTDNINTMVNAVGKNVLNDNEEFVKIIEEQRYNLLKHISKTMTEGLRFKGDKFTKEDSVKLSKIIYDEFLNNDFYKNYREKVSTTEFSKSEKTIILDHDKSKTIPSINKRIAEIIDDEKEIEYTTSKYWYTFILFNLEILPILEDDSDKKMEEYFLKKLAENLFAAQK